MNIESVETRNVILVMEKMIPVSVEESGEALFVEINAKVVEVIIVEDNEKEGEIIPVVFDNNGIVVEMVFTCKIVLVEETGNVADISLVKEIITAVVEKTIVDVFEDDVIFDTSVLLVVDGIGIGIVFARVDLGNDVVVVETSIIGVSVEYEIDDEVSENVYRVSDVEKIGDEISVVIYVASDVEEIGDEISEDSVEKMYEISVVFVDVVVASLFVTKLLHFRIVNLN